MTDQETRKAEFIAVNTQAREIYLDGYLRGYENGFKDADQTAEAEYIRSAQAAAKSAAAGLDVARHRAEQTGGNRS
ncbi:hypothetical protein CGQ24_07340 [Arthrobacter sp. 7749]|nr:hypothetical protein CGQ24_07340 [Arthrobacter sp. 7749]